MVGLSCSARSTLPHFPPLSIETAGDLAPGSDDSAGHPSYHPGGELLACSADTHSPHGQRPGNTQQTPRCEVARPRMGRCGGSCGEMWSRRRAPRAEITGGAGPCTRETATPHLIGAASPSVCGCQAMSGLILLEPSPESVLHAFGETAGLALPSTLSGRSTAWTAGRGVAAGPIALRDPLGRADQQQYARGEHDDEADQADDREAAGLHRGGDAGDK